jgi:phosphatidylglycerol lysyltransferase
MLPRRLTRPTSETYSVEFVAECADRVAEVLGAVGHEAGQYHALSPDPWKVLWNDDRSGFVLFIEEGRCIFVWRSPVAAPGLELDMLSRLLAYARRRRKAVIGVLVNDAYCAAGVRLGMKPIWAAYESYHSLADWTIQGGRREKLRLARNHARKLGYSWREADPVNNAADRASLEATEAEWKRARKQRATDSFQRTSFAELTEIRRYFVCEGPMADTPDAPNGVVSFVGCTPVNSDGWYLQDPVRLESAPRGALEGCFIAAMDAFRDDGYKLVSNGPLPFWRPDGAPDNQHQLGPVGQRVVNFFDRQYRFKGINQFRSKLDPDRIEPLYILLSRRMITPGTARSVVRVLTKRLSN